MNDKLVKFTEKDFKTRAQEILLMAKDKQVAIVDANGKIITVIGVGQTRLLPDPISQFELDDNPVEGIKDRHNPWLK